MSCCAVYTSAMTIPPAAPFILTAELPADVLRWADGLRRAHYPLERNVLSAHVTLFHSFAPSLHEALPRFAMRMAGEFSPPEAVLTGLMDLGQGTALAIRSPALQAVRQCIADHFDDVLTRQDRGGKKLHITIQNKVTRADALALQRELGPLIQPRPFHFTGLALHIYRNPHWEAAGLWKFRGKERP